MGHLIAQLIINYKRPVKNYYYGSFQGPSPSSSHMPLLAWLNYSLLSSPWISNCSRLGYAVCEGRPFREHRLPCCGVGIGWFLFILGFFLGAIPWYIGAFLLLCVRMDYREKPGLIVCTLAALLAAVAVTLGVTKATHAW